jgi:hypothetical protein
MGSLSSPRQRRKDVNIKKLECKESRAGSLETSIYKTFVAGGGVSLRMLTGAPNYNSSTFRVLLSYNQKLPVPLR